MTSDDGQGSNQGNSNWSQYVLDNSGGYLDGASYNQLGLSWSGQFDPEYLGDHGKKGKDPVPEPGTLSLFLTALLGGALFLRARKAQGP